MAGERDGLMQLWSKTGYDWGFFRYTWVKGDFDESWQGPLRQSNMSMEKLHLYHLHSFMDDFPVKKVLMYFEIPKIGVPPKSSTLMEFSIINHPAIGVPPMTSWKPTASQEAWPLAGGMYPTNLKAEVHQHRSKWAPRKFDVVGRLLRKYLGILFDILCDFTGRQQFGGGM